MSIDPRRVAVAFCAIGAFLHLYAPQPVLPMIAAEYGASPTQASLIITAGTLAVAATAKVPAVMIRLASAAPTPYSRAIIGSTACGA